MDRNKAPIMSHADACRAALTCYEMAKLLRLDQQTWREIYKKDVTDKVCQVRLVGYTDGLRDAYETAIIRDLCSFHYLVQGKWYTTGSYVQLAAIERKGAQFANLWKDSDQHFTPLVEAEFTGQL